EFTDLPVDPLRRADAILAEKRLDHPLAVSLAVRERRQRDGRAPATTTTTNHSSPPACPSAPASKPSTPPAASTSTTQPPGPDPRRTYGRDHLATARPQPVQHAGAPELSRVTTPATCPTSTSPVTRSMTPVLPGRKSRCRPATSAARPATWSWTATS